MKSFLIILLLSSIISYSQSDTARYGVRINRPIDYEKLAKFDLDSALIATELLARTVKPKFVLKGLSIRLLSGGWQGEALGDNWGGLPQTLVRPNKRIFFKNDSIFFYGNNILERATTYRIVTLSPDSVRYRQPLFAFSDSGDKWGLTLYEVGEDVPWHGKATKLFLLFSKEPNCVCGCPEELYSQDTSFQINRY